MESILEDKALQKRIAIAVIAVVVVLVAVGIVMIPKVLGILTSTVTIQSNGTVNIPPG
jgi:NADH:ubiquinone oxidoreductase subunit 3 (subunit A)